jgi:hypothetical protein
LTITSYPSVAAAGAGMDNRLSAHLEQGILPNSLKVPDVVSVCTQVEYLVLVFIAQAVTGAQLQSSNGYVTVASPPIVITTGAVIVVVAGIACATTIQYF